MKGADLLAWIHTSLSKSAFKWANTYDRSFEFDTHRIRIELFKSIGLVGGRYTRGITLENIHVKEGYRRQGMCRDFMALLVHTARDVGLDFVKIENIMSPHVLRVAKGFEKHEIKNENEYHPSVYVWLK